VDRRLVLIDLDGFRDALDILQMAPPWAFGSPRPQLGRRNHVEDDTRQITAAHRGIGNAGDGKLMAARCGAATRLRAAADLVAAQAVAQRAPETHDDGGMIGGWRRVRNDLAINKFITPGVAELALVGSSTLVCRPTAACHTRRVVHVILRRARLAVSARNGQRGPWPRSGACACEG
jgi:hypothetical protein